MGSSGASGRPFALRLDRSAMQWSTGHGADAPDGSASEAKGDAETLHVGVHRWIGHMPFAQRIAKFQQTHFLASQARRREDEQQHTITFADGVVSSIESMAARTSAHPRYPGTLVSF
jgi:hypothetical protein